MCNFLSFEIGTKNLNAKLTLNLKHPVLYLMLDFNEEKQDYLFI